MPHPEGYRKALRCMRIAEKFGRPVISIVDVTAAYPGPGAEERGQAEAIACNLREMSRLRVPTISVISGEGGSGGALALAVADRVLMLENAVYFVAPPEFAASLTWRNPEQKHLAAKAMRVSAPEILELGCVDEIVPEPPGGAHTGPAAATELLKGALKKSLSEIQDLRCQRMEIEVFGAIVLQSARILQRPPTAAREASSVPLPSATLLFPEGNPEGLLSPDTTTLQTLAAE
jgi:acetyl-CoA carboxylase carboxyl transferase subunit alpha